MAKMIIIKQDVLETSEINETPFTSSMKIVYSHLRNSADFFGKSYSPTITNIAKFLNMPLSEVTAAYRTLKHLGLVSEVLAGGRVRVRVTDLRDLEAL